MNDNNFEFTIQNTDYFGHTIDMIFIVENESVEKMIEKAIRDIVKKCDKGHKYSAVDVDIQNNEEYNSINITYKGPSIDDRYIYDHIYCSYDLAKRLVTRDFKEIKCIAVEFDSGPVSDSHISEYKIQKWKELDKRYQ